MEGSAYMKGYKIVGEPKVLQKKSNRKQNENERFRQRQRETQRISKMANDKKIKKDEIVPSFSIQREEMP